MQRGTAVEMPVFIRPQMVSLGQWPNAIPFGSGSFREETKMERRLLWTMGKMSLSLRETPQEVNRKQAAQLLSSAIFMAKRTPALGQSLSYGQKKVTLLSRQINTQSLLSPRTWGTCSARAYISLFLKPLWFGSVSWQLKGEKRRMQWTLMPFPGTRHHLDAKGNRHPSPAPERCTKLDGKTLDSFQCGICKDSLP